MTRQKILLIISLSMLLISAVFMESVIDSKSIAGKPPLGEAKDIALILVQMLGIRELALGFLWIQFDCDSAMMLANSHRLLPTLDAITWLAPDDIDAWGLKTYMRIVHSKNTRPAFVEITLEKFDKAVQAHPDSWEFPFEMGRQLYYTLASPARALPYLEKAMQGNDHHIKVEKLYSSLLIELKRNDEAISLFKKVLTRPDLDQLDRIIFEKRLKDIL